MQIPANIQLCAVTKNRSLEQIEAVLSSNPNIKIIAENRWPDCQEAFEKFSNYNKHFIGPLQSNKIKKVMPLVDCIQSVESFEKMKKINEAAEELGRKIDFMFQVNISCDSAKQGMSEVELWDALKKYVATPPSNARLVGLMTIGARVELPERREYFRRMKALYDSVKIWIQDYPDLATKFCNLSMGMSEDYQIAIEEGATMVRLGSVLFC